MVRRRPPAAPAVKTLSTIHSEEAARHFAWIDWLLARTGKTDTALADEAGLQRNYLYRKRREGTVLGAAQIRILGEFWGVPGPDSYLLPGTVGFSDEGAAYDPGTPSTDPVLQAMIDAALKGRASASCWRLKTRALEDAGYLIGDIVIADAAVAPRAGDAVVAQVYDLRTGTAETIVRISEPPYLVAASSDPGLRKPMLVDNERVIVWGAITQSLRTRRA
jgi:hypothetical protein